MAVGLKISSEGVVVEAAVFKVVPYGWIGAVGGAGIGWSYDGSVFTAPEPKPVEPPTVAEQIAALEASVTARNIRGAALGDDFAIQHIQSVEDKIQALRA